METQASHKEAYETSTEEVDRKFADTKAAFESSRLYDDKCDHSIEKNSTLHYQNVSSTLVATPVQTT